MVKKYDPLKPPAFPLDIVRKHFGPGSDSKLAAQLKHDNAALYNAMRDVAEEYDIVGPRPYFRPSDAPAPAGKKQFLAAEQSAMAEFSEADCNAYFRLSSNEPGSKNAAKLASTDQAAYERLRLSAKARGILPSEPSVVVVNHRADKPASPKPSDANKFRLSDELALQAGIATGTMVDIDGFGKICHQIGQNKRAAERRAAEAAPKVQTDQAAKPDNNEGDDAAPAVKAA